MAIESTSAVPEEDEEMRE
jgi:hypothetical protein